MNGGLVEMFEYNRWANLALLEGCRGVADRALDAKVAGVSGSARSLLTHIVGGEQTFILRTKGRQHEGELNRFSAWPGWDELARLAGETGTALIDIARGLDDAAVADLPWQGKVFRFPVRFFLVHAMEHSTEHRTEMKVALGSLGVETPNLDGWEYGAARGYGAEG